MKTVITCVCYNFVACNNIKKFDFYSFFEPDSFYESHTEKRDQETTTISVESNDNQNAIKKRESFMKCNKNISLRSYFYCGSSDLKWQKNKQTKNNFYFCLSC